MESISLECRAEGHRRHSCTCHATSGARSSLIGRAAWRYFCLKRMSGWRCPGPGQTLLDVGGWLDATKYSEGMEGLWR
jgi:hypothetical protein